VTTTSACFNCGDPTHWRKDCPVCGNDRRRRTSQQGQVVVNSNLEQTAEIFVRTEIFERNVMAILDTGCEMSIIISLLMDSTPLEETNLKLYAANGTDIPLLKTVKIPIVIEGYSTMAKVVVSDVIDELILGVDWLTTQGCVWDFKKATLNIGEWQIPVRRRPAHSKVRRIIVATEQTVPARSFKDIPVRMIWKNLSERTPDWVSEPNQIIRYVVTARSLSRGTATEGYLRILNCGDSSHRLRPGETIGTAKPAVVAEENQFQLPHEPNEVGSESSESVPRQNGIDATLLEKGDEAEVVHVASVVDSLSSDLTSEQRQQAVDFILVHGSSLPSLNST
jgi:predicted aspartyl protease